MFKQFAKLEIIRFAWLALSVCLGWAAPAAAQYPTKPIRFIVPYAPGRLRNKIFKCGGIDRESLRNEWSTSIGRG